MQVHSPSPEASPPAAPASAEPLSNPLIYLGVMLVFLALAGFVALILGRQVQQAFTTNPGLNGLILAVLLVGILLALGQILKLGREVRWVNGLLREGEAGRGGRTRHPVLLAPMEAMMQGRRGRPRLPLASGRMLLDSVAARLDEARDTARYLVGLLVFLGLLGTFWGLLTTIGSISATIQSLDPAAGDAATVLDSVKNGLSAPLSGMGTAFSSSLFGLSGSLVLGFLDLQVGRAQGRFYTELEDLLSFEAETSAPSLAMIANMPNMPNGAEEFRVLADRINRLVLEQSNAPRTSAAMASLAESIQGLVQHMRGEQQMLRDFVEAQADEQREMRRALDRLNHSLSDIERT